MSVATPFYKCPLGCKSFFNLLFKVFKKIKTNDINKLVEITGAPPFPSTQRVRHVAYIISALLHNDNGRNNLKESVSDCIKNIFSEIETLEDDDIDNVSVFLSHLYQDDIDRENSILNIFKCINEEIIIAFVEAIIAKDNLFDKDTESEIVNFICTSDKVNTVFLCRLSIAILSIERDNDVYKALLSTALDEAIKAATIEYDIDNEKEAARNPEPHGLVCELIGGKTTIKRNDKILKVTELGYELRLRGLSYNGTKSQRVSRLSQNLEKPRFKDEILNMKMNEKKNG